MAAIIQEERELITKLMKQTDLGEITGEILPVSGGLMHRMYKVYAGQIPYAVKHLNPEIMKRPDAKGNFAAAEALEKILEEKGLPIVPAMSFAGEKMQEVEGNYFYIYRWQEGKITDFDSIDTHQCRKVGRILGQMHAIDSRNMPEEDFDFTPVDFAAFLEEGKNLPAKIAGMLKNQLDELSDVQASILAAGNKLPSMRVISDADMDPKNVMWYEKEPSIIDLECLDYANPMRAVLELGIQWALRSVSKDGMTTHEFLRENLLAFFEGYLEAYDNGYRSYEDLYGLVYQNWVEWLEYNLNRAMGVETSSEEEIRLGESEAANTLLLIHDLAEIEPQVRDMLEKDLPSIDHRRFDTHDEKLCYYEIMFEGDLSSIPEYSLPAGYSIAAVSADENMEDIKKDWIGIEFSAKEFSSYEQGEASWEKYYASRQEMLPGRMFFVKDAVGKRVATATAFFDIYGRNKSGAGWLHWVAVRRQEQGKGLSKPLICAVLQRMKELGHTKVKIPTQTTTWLACKVYYDLGFRPIPQNLENSRAGWKMLEQLTGMHVLK